MYMDYAKLWKFLIDKGLTKNDLMELTGISSRVVAKLTKNQTVTTDTLVKICRALHCGVADIMEYVAEREMTLYQCYKQFGQRVEETEEYTATEFVYREQPYLVYLTKRTANKATHIHCKADKTVVWEQLHMFGGVATPGREQTVLVRPKPCKDRRVLVIVKGKPALVVGQDENGFLSAGRQPKALTDLYLMTEAELKLFEPME